MIFPKNGGSVDAIDHFWGEWSSKVIFLGGVEIKLVDFGGSVVPFYEQEQKLLNTSARQTNKLSKLSKLSNCQSVKIVNTVKLPNC